MKITILILALLAGCNIRQSFQPPLYNYESFQKPGATEVDVMKALLECGMVDPIGDLRLGYSNPDWNKITNKEYQELKESTTYAELCMFNDGFKLTPKANSAVCKVAPSLQACKPENAHLIPIRDVNRRLNSSYCKAYPKADACQP